MRISWLIVLGLALAGCKGELASGAGGGVSESIANNDVPVNTSVTGVGTTALRRLSRAELNATLRDLLGDTTSAGNTLPEDTVDPFDNNYKTQRVSMALVEALENLATDVAVRAMEPTNARRDAIVGCTPSVADDAVCFDAFVRSFGQRAFRRPLNDEDVARYRPLLAYGAEDDNFYTATALVIQAMLQEPMFVYHVERGVPVEGRPGVLRLNAYEVASRLSYFLWGTMPDDALMTAAGQGELDTPQGVRAVAETMLGDPRARERMVRFHAMWMGWHRLDAQTPLGAAMVRESSALIERVVFDEKRDYMDLFTLDETFLMPELATHYGLPSVAAQGEWVPYTDAGRAGILSHAAFLQVVSKFGDTSPTQRGKLIRERLMCQPVAPPPPVVNTDEPPSGGTSTCKIDRYLAIQDAPGCGACHAQMDFIGFGLENYDETGRYRAAEDDDPSCTIDVDGEITGVGTFRGPGQLGALLAGNDALANCAVTQLYRFAYAHTEGADDAEAIAQLQAAFAASGHRFDTLILDLVGQESFLYRKVEGP